MTPLSKQVRLSDQLRCSECIEIGLFFHFNSTSAVVWPRRIDPKGDIASSAPWKKARTLGPSTIHEAWAESRFDAICAPSPNA
jgi:hypothetical protein